jgi:hypothetical protein
MPEYQQGTFGEFVDFGPAKVVALHGEEAVVPKGGGTSLAAEIAGALGGLSNGDILEALAAIERAILTKSTTSVQIDAREIVKATHAVYDAGGSLLTEAREVLGMA